MPTDAQVLENSQMVDVTTPVVLISGPVGVGKTTVGQALSELLEHKQWPHTFVDFDQLRYTYPRPASDPWGNELGLKNLADVWKNCSQLGSLNLIIAYVVERKSFIERIQSAVPRASIVTFQLTAKLETLEKRVRQRETGASLDWHLNRAAELARTLERQDSPSDFRIATDDRSVFDIAAEMTDLIHWRSP
ncbi:MAG: AAA family ATPase [Leptolyngbyaceae cyanobacterium]